MVRRILLPTDSSLPAIAATVDAVRLAKDRQATLIILHVVELTPTMEVEQHAENVGLKRCPDIDGVAFARELAKKEGVLTEEIIKEGPVTGEIVHVAEDFKVESIVMGASRPHGMTELYLGDVARAVSKMAKCEVITINPTPEQGKVALAMARSMDGKEKPKSVKSITSTKQFKIGLLLFFAYTTFYVIFILLGSFARDVMGSLTLGTNVGIILGMLVIIIAIVMAVVFNWYAGKMERKQGA